MPTSVSEAEIQMCRRVCAAASQQEIEIKEHNTRFGYSFSWRMKDGRTVDGPISKDRQVALLDGCRQLLPHIFAHV